MANVTADDVKLVFEAWRKYRPHPNLCRFTKDREKLIRDRLKLGYTAQDLVTLMEYVNTANTGFARWMRGDNPRRRAYLDLQNLLRKEKLGGRVEEALVWKAGEQQPDPDDDPDLDLGPLAHLRR